MLPHFYWKSNRARDRGTGLRPLPWPAPTHVNRNSFFRDSERVRIAAHLGLVEVNLGYLAQRCAGRLAGLLTSRLLHSFPLMRRSASRADDVDRVLGLLDEDNEQNTTLFGLTNQNRALRIQCVLHHRRERVTTLRNPYRTDKRTWPILSRPYLRFPRILVRPRSGHSWLALFGSVRCSRPNPWLQGSACPRPRCTGSASAANCTTCASRTRSGSRQTLLRRSSARWLLPHPGDPAEIRRYAHSEARHPTWHQLDEGNITALVETELAFLERRLRRYGSRRSRRRASRAWGRGCCRSHGWWRPSASRRSAAARDGRCGRSWPRCTSSVSTSRRRAPSSG